MSKTISPPLQEEELIHLLKQKDRKGFAVLYDNYANALYGVILKIIQIEELAKDVLQDSFVKIWKNIHTYNANKGTLFTWILNIARNTAIDKTRSADYKQIIRKQSIETISIEDSTYFTNTQTDAIGLNKQIAQLKPEHQEIIDWIYFKGYTQSEVAKALEIPLGTVKTRVRLAIQHLRRLT